MENNWSEDFQQEVATGTFHISRGYHLSFSPHGRLILAWAGEMLLNCLKQLRITASTSSGNEVDFFFSSSRSQSKAAACHQFSSVAQSCPTLWPHESQHARPPCPSPTPTVHSDSCPSSQWCHPAISSSVVPLLLLPPIPPSIRVFSNESTLHHNLFLFVLSWELLINSNSITISMLISTPHADFSLGHPSCVLSCL